MYCFCNRFFENKVIRIIVSVLLIAVFLIVPFEHRMLTAHAALSAAVAISVICAVLIAMGFSFGSLVIGNSNFASNVSFNVHQSMYDLATEIWENCPGIAEAIANAFPGGLFILNTAKTIIQIAPALYVLIKKYIVDRYGDTAEEVEKHVNQQYSFNGKAIKIGGIHAVLTGSCEVINSPYIYPSITIGDRNFYWEFRSVNASNIYTYRAYYGSELIYSISTKSPEYCGVAVFYDRINVPNSTYPYGSAACYVYFPYMRYEDGVEYMFAGSMKQFTYAFTTAKEYEDALAASAGETEVDDMARAITVDDEVFSSAVEKYPEYVYVSNNTNDYLTKTITDVAAPAYSEIYDSLVVDNVARTVSWQGDRTLCPIDELEGALPTAVIGHWVATWDETSTLCNISCYADDGTVAWTGTVTTTLTWADVIAQLGTISDTIVGTATGTIALPNATLDFEPLKIAGETFSKKFPFCLPFDLYRAFKQFDYGDEAQAPVYKIPLNFGEQFGTHYIVLDMNQWTPVANIAKWCVYLSFVVSLILVTKKIMGGS